MNQENFEVAFPFLDGKVLDGNVAGAISGDRGIDHVDGRHVVFVDGGWSGLGIPEIGENSTEKFDVFGRDNSGKKFGLGGAESSDRLCFGAIGNEASSEGRAIASGGSAIA